MKAFATYLLALLCIVFTIDRGLGYLCNKLYTENKTGATGGKINYYLSLPPPSLLIMGSSRALSAIPDSFKVSCFNLGHEGMDDVFQTGLLDILIKQKKIPRTILLHVDPEKYSSLDTDTYSAAIQNLRYYYGKDSLVTEYINEVSFHERFFFLFHLYRYNGRAINLIKNAMLSSKFFKPYSGSELLAPATDDSTNTTIQSKKPFKDGPFRMNRLRYLFKFISLCKQNHIRLILYTSPAYMSHFKESTAFDSIVHAENIPYINYLKIGLPVVENNPALWKDGVHLNSTGAQYLSGDLAKRVSQLAGTR
jgi:hypothetical protein